MNTNKFIFSILLAAGVSAMTTSCSDFLDKESDLSLSADQVFEKYENERGFLAYVYTFLPDAFAGYTDTQYLGSNECMTDNALSYWNVNRYHSVLNDSYDATNHWFASHYWERNTSAIRAANQFMTNARENVIGNATKSGDDNHLYDRYMAEARLLRAIFHMDMVGWFGAIPVIGDRVDDEGNRTPIVFKADGSDAKEMTRTPAAEALQWIADECDAVKDVLPFRYSNENENWGRVNGAAAYALKARALLYKASPLNNPNGDKTLWQEAAQAALDFISKNNQQSRPYKLYTTDDNDPNQNYYQCFVSTPHLNDEFILSRSEWTTNALEYNNAPCGFQNSTGRVNPTQNLVDAYEMKNGLPIDDPNSGYDEQDPYKNRDPRFDQTIFHQGSIWGDSIQEERRAVDVTVGTGTDYQSLHGGTTTGYYSKKYVINMSFKQPTTNPHACPIFRYAEILLNAAEALNEAGQTEQAYQYVNQVRARVGMPAYSGMTQAKLRERIRNERRIELCFEDHRFFDERRWKLFDENGSAAAETSKPRYQQVFNIYSVQVTPDGSQTYTYTHDNTHPTRSFTSPKNYYFPIPDTETKKAPKLGQNSGWELKASTGDDTSSESGTTEGSETTGE